MSAADVRRRIRRPSGHWLLLALILVSLTLALLVQGVAEVSRSSTAPRAPVPASLGLRKAGPIIDFSEGRMRSIGPRPRTVALTFDDGPDPTWTPRVLEVLARHRVPATFFVSGARVVAHPKLVQTQLRRGHEIGSHTFTHADLASLPSWRQRLELSLTQRALAGAAGIHTSLFRPPYSSSPDALGLEDLDAARAAGAGGYLVVFAQKNSEDWKGYGARQIVARSLPSGGRGAVVLMHDGGGNRANTVTALERLIPALKAKGYRFSTVSEITGRARSDVMRPVGRGERLHGMAFSWAMHVSSKVVGVLSFLPIPITALLIARALVLVWFSRRHVSRSRRRRNSDLFLPPVSIVVPAFNEEIGIAASIRSLAASDYPQFEVVVVDDGSQDQTAAVVEGLNDAKVVLVRQENMGKARALNAGIARSKHPIVVMVDADTLFERDTLRWLVQPFSDPKVGGVSGNTKVGNRKGLVGQWQHIEYVMGFNLDRRLYDVLDCMPTIPGAVGAFRREALAAAGGVSDDTLAEDTDLTMAINRAGWRVAYQDRAVAWTEIPTSLGGLWRQRYRWSYGILQCLWKHRAAVWARNEPGHVGRAIPYLLLFNVIAPLLSPAIDLFALYGILFVHPVHVLVYWSLFNLVQLGIGLYAFKLDGERLAPLLLGPLQQFVYRQLMYLVIIQSVVSALLGARLGWRKLVRTGQVRMPAPTE